MPPSEREKGGVEKIARIAMPFVAVAAAWQAVVWMGWFPEYLFPGPLAVLRDFLDRAVYSHSLLRHVGDSLLRLFVGCTLGIAGGVAMGVAMGLSRPLWSFFGPLLDFGHAIPGIAWLPVAILWFGIGFRTITVIIFLVVFFPVLYGTLTGIRTMSTKYTNVALMCGASRGQIVAHVLLPGAMPSIMNGIRGGVAFGWRGLISAEMIIASSGIGWLIIDARSWLNTQTVLLGAFIIGILWLLIDRLILSELETRTIEKWGMIQKP